MITLYYTPNVCAMAQHIVLEWIGQSYNAVEVVMGSDDFKNIAPKGMVPAMIDDDSALMTQGAALLKYLVAKYPEADLGSDGSLQGEYKLDFALSFVASDLHKSFPSVFYPHRFTTDESEQAIESVKQAGIANVNQQMEYLNSHLENNTYMVGDKKTVADAYAFTVIRWTGGLEKTFQDYPNIKRFFDTMMSDEGVQKVLKIHNPETS